MEAKDPAKADGTETDLISMDLEGQKLLSLQAQHNFTSEMKFNGEEGGENDGENIAEGRIEEEKDSGDEELDDAELERAEVSTRGLNKGRKNED